eukprot:7852533-Lingulodinium_polyedra.AAC.1
MAWHGMTWPFSWAFETRMVPNAHSRLDKPHSGLYSKSNAQKRCSVDNLAKVRCERSHGMA